MRSSWGPLHKLSSLPGHSLSTKCGPSLVRSELGQDTVARLYPRRRGALQISVLWLARKRVVFDIAQQSRDFIVSLSFVMSLSSSWKRQAL